MIEWAGLCGFLRDCYEADNRETGIANLFSRDIRHLHFPLMGGEVLNGNLDHVPMDLKPAQAMDRDATLNSTEKSLIMGFFFLVGESRDQFRSRIVAPLLYAPARIEYNKSFAFVRPDLQEIHLNSRIIARILGGGAGDGALQQLHEKLPALPITANNIDSLTEVLQAAIPELDVSAMKSYPKMITEEELQSAAKFDRNNILLAPGVAVALVPMSPDTRQALAELGELTRLDPDSPPLKALLEIPAKKNKIIEIDHLLPASLSNPQKQLLTSAANFPLTVVIGPPGTGKSFTIAAIALTHAARGESVLIAARQDQALAVIERLLLKLAGGKVPILRGGRGEATQRLKEELDDILQDNKLMRLAPQWAPIKLEKKQLRRCRARVHKKRRHFQRRVQLERTLFHLQSNENSSLMGKVRRWRRISLEKRLQSRQPLWELAADLDSEETQYLELKADYLRSIMAKRLSDVIEAERLQLVSLSRALRARTKLRLCKYFEKLDLKVVQWALPIWLTTIADVGELLPLQPGLFDVALIDEATQCDVASCLPVFYRARRAVVTGDPRQLRHISFLSEARITTLAEKNGIDEGIREQFHYRRRSLMDLVIEAAASGLQVAMLDEHFRSRPRIIEFSNREFYKGQLAIMTRRPDSIRARSLSLRKIEGKRNKQGINAAEANALIDELMQWIEKEKSLPPHVCHSLGVLSPFREQVERLARLITKKIPAESIIKHRLLVATAYGFQGEERDIMFLSMTVDKNSYAGEIRYIERPDVFNVSITRARQYQVIFSSVTRDDVGAGLMGRYLEYMEEQMAPSPMPVGKREEFLREVAEELTANGYTVWPRFNVAGREVDIVIERAGRAVGIDLIGPAGEIGEAMDHGEARLLGRAGLKLFPLPLSAWRLDRPGCLNAIARCFETIPDDIPAEFSPSESHTK